MKKTIAVTLMVVMLTSGASSFAAETTNKIATHPITGATKTITLQVAAPVVNQTEAQLLAKEFYFNGTYYPFGYWMGASEAQAKTNFLNTVKLMNSQVKVGTIDDLAINDARTTYLALKTQDELVYETVTKQILAKYPVLTTGTAQQKSERQMEQIYAYVQWLNLNTRYDYDALKSSSMELLYKGDRETDDLLNLRMRTEASKEYKALTSYKAKTDLVAKKLNEYVAYMKASNKTLRETVNNKSESGIKFSGVCQEYAILTKKVLPQFGIETDYLSNETHAWNIVRLANGGTFHLDTTNAGTGQVFVFNLKREFAPEEYAAADWLLNKLTQEISFIPSKRLSEAMGGYNRQIRIPEGDIVSAMGTLEKAQAWSSKLNPTDNGNFGIYK